MQLNERSCRAPVKFIAPTFLTCKKYSAPQGLALPRRNNLIHLTFTLRHDDELQLGQPALHVRFAGCIHCQPLLITHVFRFREAEDAVLAIDNSFSIYFLFLLDTS